MVAFDNIYIAPRVRVALNSVLEQNYTRKFWSLLHKLKSGRFDIPGLRVEKLHTSRGKVYSARLNVDIRVIFSICADKIEKSLIIWDVDHHDDAYGKVDRAVVPALFSEDTSNLEAIALESEGEVESLSQMFLSDEPDDESMIDGLILFKIPSEVIAEPQRFYAFEPQIDRYLRLTPQQEELLGKTDRAYLVQGSAGTGKTTLALFHALNLYQSQAQGDVLLFTYQEELACVCRCYAVNLTGEESAKGLHVFSYLEFCRLYLRKQIADAPTNWRWINRETSIQHLSDIVASRPRWSRFLQAEDIYGYIYSILKGRFVPGSDQLARSAEDFRRILKGYGSVPDNFEDILEIFALYEQRLASFNHKDEADLIRFCYDSLKSRALLSDKMDPSWIVIDELQDFTELEWKSLLLFWENNCSLSRDNPGFPFLSGDRNQNISRSGFRWQEVDSYVERILKRIHRPSAFEKVLLHQNFRNTRQIFAVGEFFRLLSPDTAAGDAPPVLTGRKPTLVIGEESDFKTFLNSVAATEESAAPLVVLSEAENMSRIKWKQPASGESPIFVMPLRAAKGMEFEDVVLYRLFSTLEAIEKGSETATTARLYDLWYMAVMRARQNLLVFLTGDDWQRAQALFADRFEQFKAHFDIVEQAQAKNALQEFFNRREKHLPNYHVIFLERVRAQQSWEDFRKTKSERSRDAALRLWKKCRDWRSLGQAYQELERFADAIPYIRKANLFNDLGRCLEATGRFEEAAQAYEEDGAHVDAARCYALASDHSRAGQIYAEHRQWLAAAQCYVASHESDKAAQCFANAGAWDQSAQHYQLTENWAQAAAAYTQAKKYQLAGDMYLQSDDKSAAAASYAQAGQNERAAELFVAVEDWTAAADCFNQAQIFDRASAMYLLAGQLSQAAEANEKAGDLAAAGSGYERVKDWHRAALAYLQSGDMLKAIDCYENDLDWQSALDLHNQLDQRQPRRIALCYERLGQYEQALENYLLAQADNEAAYCLEKLERFAEAAQHYLKANNLTAAAPLLARAGERMEAACLYLQAGQKDLAIEVARGIPALKGREKIPDLRTQLAEWAENNQRPDLSAAVYEDITDYSKAGERYRSAMMFAKAAECFERAKKFQLAGDLYAQAAKFDNAAECFKRSKQWKKAAEYYELLKRWRDAKAMYELCKDPEGVIRCESAAEWF